MICRFPTRPWPLILLVLLLTARSASADAPEDADDGGAAASDPTAAVNFQDLKLRYFDLNRGNEEITLEAEGAHVFVPEFKLVHKLVGTHTNRSGDWETGPRELSLKPTYLQPVAPFGVRAKFALGLEWIKDLGRTRKGTGTGTDQIAPLIGVGWLPTKNDFVVTLFQYFHSYEEDEGVQKVRQSGPRLIYIRKIPLINGWGKADWKNIIDHEEDNDVTMTLELQLGTMVTDGIGIYGEAFVGDSVVDGEPYDLGVGIGLRFLY